VYTITEINSTDCQYTSVQTEQVAIMIYSKYQLLKGEMANTLKQKHPTNDLLNI